MKQKYFYFLLFTFSYFISLSQTATHLNFDGVDDHIILLNESNFDFTNQMTVEFWMQSNTTPQQWDTFVAKGDTSWRVSLTATGNVAFSGTGAFADIFSTTSVTDGNWHHVAVTYDGVFAKIYIDGSLESQIAGTSNINNSNVNVSIGENLQMTGRKYTGNMDEVRIWNQSRTFSEINASINCELQATEIGLVAYYKFNQGIDQGNNSSETNLIDSSPNNNNGILKNFALNGVSSNWLAGSVMQSLQAPTVTTPINYTYGSAATPLTAISGDIGLLWYTTATGGTGSTIAPTPNTSIPGTTSYWVSSTYSSGCESERVEIVVTVDAPVLATHLNFDGVNDYITLTNESIFDFTNQMTVEFWMNSNILPEQWDALIVKGDDSWRVSMSTAGEIAFTGSGAFTDFFSTTSVTDGNWHHVAVTYDGVNAKIYIDGVLENQLAGTANINNSGYNVTIGENLQMTGRNYTGNMDEVRIWNIARTIEQINHTKNCELQGTEAGLVAYYQFNQGIDQANNVSENVLTDSTLNNTNGTLSNFTLSGSSSNWLTGSSVETNSTIPGIPTVTTPIIYNLGETATTLSATIGTGGTGLLWYTTANGGVGNTSVIPSTATVGDTSYWVSSINTNGCESERVEVVVTVNLFAPVPTTNWPTQVYTGDDKTLSDLQVTGTAIQWYDASTGGNLLPNTTSLVDETTYYATQTIGGLESDLRLAITVKRISDNTQIQSNISTVANLQSTPSSQFTTQWFSTATGGTALNSTDILASGIYYVEQNKAASIEVLASGLSKPVGVGIQSDGKIVFSNAHPINSFIQRMDTDGSNIITLGNGFSVPYGIAIQSDDKIIIADSFNSVIKRMETDGSNIVTLGSGFNNPTGVAIQSDGKIVIADRNNNVVKRMNADGSNIEILGSGFNLPSDVAIQIDGKIVIADTGNGTIKRMDADGSNIVTLITGSYNGLAIQNDGRIVFTQQSSNSVKRMDADGSNVEILATGFSQPQQIAIQTDGKIVITDRIDNLIKRITDVVQSNRVAVEVIIVPIPTANWTTQVYTGDDKTLSDLHVTGTAIQWYDASTGGNLLPNTTTLVDETTYYASQTISGHESPVRLGITVNRISDNSQLISFPSTIGNLTSTPSIGTYTNWYENASDSTPLFAEFLNNGTYYVNQAIHSFTTEILGSGFTKPSDVDIQQDGKIIIADLYNDAVKRMNADGTNIEILGTFGGPFGVATQTDGKIIVSSNDFTIKRMNSDGSNIEILLEPDTSTLPAQYIRSYGIAVQSDLKIVFTDKLNNAVKRMNSDGSNIEVLGGGFNNPTGVAIQSDGKILVADNGNNVIKRMDSDGSNIVILGTGFSSPDKVEVQANGKIIISDTGNGAVKRMNFDGTNIEVLSNGFNLPKGIAIESNGNIILAVYGNDQVKRITQFNQLESNRVPVQIIQDCNSTTWNGDSWSNGTPDSNKAAIFDSNYTINADIHVCKFEVNNNANVTLSAGITLTVNNEIVVAANGNLTVENDAVILQNNPYAINSGNVVVNRNSVPMIRLDYTAWSSPVSDQNILSFSPNTVTNRFYTYDSSGTNTATSWVSIDPSSNNFSAGVGYLIRVANNWSSVTPASYLGAFNGVPHNGTIANPIGIGYNLIGNPYPSPINADLFLTDNSSLGVNTLYFWTHVVPQNGSYTAQSNYASYNIVGGVAASAGGVIPDGVIQVGQGFFHNVSTAGNVTFNNNQRRGTSNGQFFKSSQSNNVERHRIWLSLKDDSTEFNQFLVAYMDGATNGLDIQYDGKLLTNATSTLSSIINNEDYVIQAKAFPFNDNDEVALNFVAEHDGDYTISLDNFDGLFGSQDVFLWDKALNIYHNLKLNNYSFVTVSGSFNNRFSIVYKTNTLSNEVFENQEHVSIFMNNSNQIVIKNYGGLIDNVEIFDLTGRLLYSKKNWGNPELILENNFSTNVLLVRAKSKNNKLTTRKLIKK